jgi:hypothetical protein
MAPLTPDAVREVAEWMRGWRSPDRTIRAASSVIVAEQPGGVVVYEAESIRRLIPKAVGE